MVHNTADIDALLKARAEIDEQLRQHKSTVTVLFTDIVGSTGFFERNGDTAGLAMIHRHDNLATTVVEQHGGRVIKTIGDSAMAEFSDPASAVRAGVEIEREFLKLNATLAEKQRVEVRVGIHSGVGYRKGNDLFGDVINVASRIVKRTAPAQILVSRSVYEAVSKETDLNCKWLTKLTIDGRTEKEEIFEVAWTDAEAYREVRERLMGPGSIPPRFEVLGQAGAGAAGVIYKVRDVETDEIVALKILKPEIAVDAGVQENFKKELCLSRKITHKNICRIHDFGRANGVTYASMEFVEGESLRARLNRVGLLPLSQALEIVQQICAGLREAHAQGIVHCDLKPANIMLDRSGVVKIMDFGSCRLMHDDAACKTVVGTPAYMAPEQAELKAVSAATDIYALGLVFYEMVTGTPAFSGDTPIAIALKQIRDYPKRPREIVSGFSPLLDAAIFKCIQKDAAKRFQSVDELMMALRRASKATPVPAWRVSLDRGLRQAETQARHVLSKGMEAAEEFLRRQDWSVATRIRKKFAVVTVMSLFLGGVITFGMYTGEKKKTDSPEAAGIASVRQASLSASAIRPVSVYGSSPIPAPTLIASQVDLSGSSVVAGIASSAPATPEPSAGPSPNTDQAVRAASTPPTPSSTLASRLTKHEKLAAHAAAKTQPTAHAAAQASQDSTIAELVPPTEPIQVVDAAPVAVQPDQAGNPAAATPQNNASSEEKTAAVEPKQASADSKTLSFYFEIASFKDETWATAAVDKLTQLGFHAAVIHKSVLWSQSYHVEVGPYANQMDMIAARQRLAAQGFKLGPVRSSAP